MKSFDFCFKYFELRSTIKKAAQYTNVLIGWSERIMEEAVAGDKRFRYE